MTLVHFTSSHTDISGCEVTCQYLQKCSSNALHIKKWKREITQKSMNARVMHLKPNTSLYHNLFIDEISLQKHQPNRSYQPDKKI